MYMSKDKMPWNISFGNTWEWVKTPVGILGIRILNNSRFEGNCLWNLWELLGIAKTPMRICGNS